MPLQYSFDRRANPRADLTFFYNEFISCTVVKKGLVASVDGGQTTKKVEIERENGYSLSQFLRVEPGSIEKHVIDAFFEWTDGEIEDLSSHCRIEEYLTDAEVDEYIEKLKTLIAGRPIKVRMLRQQDNFIVSINSKMCEFFRNYVDFEMYGTLQEAPDYADPLIITDKILSCKFLYLDIRLANSEVLVERFEGWGIVLRQPDPNLNFDYMTAIFQKWYSGVDSYLEYLCLALDISHESCRSLISLGEVKEITRTGKTLTELEITRADGKFCRFGRLPLKEEDGKKKKKTAPLLVYFYIGECSDDLFGFNEFGNVIL